MCDDPTHVENIKTELYECLRKRLHSKNAGEKANC